MRSHAKASSAGSTLRQGLGLSGIVCGAFVAMLVLFAASASATLTREPESFSPLTGSGSSVTIHRPSGLAIDEATGNVFLTDGTGGNKVLILSAKGTEAPVELKSPFEITGLTFAGNAGGVAYDNTESVSKGTLYVAQTNKVLKYKRDAGEEKYKAAGELPASGAGGGFGMTVDGNGNVYEGDFNSQKVREWSPAGVLLHEYSFIGTPTNRPSGLAVDAVGNLYVQRQASGGVYRYSSDGSGGIVISSPTAVTTSTATGVAYDPVSNHIFVALQGGKVAEYDATTLAKISEFGEGVLGANPERVAVNSKTGRIYVADPTPGKNNVAVFGPIVIAPTVQATAATNISGTKATLNGSVDLEGFAATECFFEWGATTSYGKTVPCEGSLPTDSNPHLVSAGISGLTPNGATYHYRVIARNTNGISRSADKSLTTADTVITEAATGIGQTVATLNGTVLPEGLAFSECAFEYKLVTDASFQQPACNPSAAQIEADFTAHPVSRSLSGLEPNSTYEFRLKATNSEAARSGQTLTFTTTGPPQVTEVRALDATQSSVSLEGKVNPSGFGTSYRFEWGPTAAYGNRVPLEFEPYVGDGTTPVRVSAKLSGLSASTIYHYRIVATSFAGTTVGSDQLAETLNSCGLPEERCFELVSRSEAGPVAIPGQGAGGFDFGYQATTEGSGGLAYHVEAGYPDATRGAEVLYRGTRGASGWSSVQLSTPILVRNEQGGAFSKSGETEWLADDLSCGFGSSNQPLTDDPVAKLVLEAGFSNLYRINPDNSYTLVNNLPSEELKGGGTVIGASQDCSKAVFRSGAHYSGIPAVGGEVLYEWDEGTLRNAGIIPGTSGEVPVSASIARPTAVSEDGSRVFFSATRQTSPNPSEIGATGIFVREDGTTTRDISLSETTTASTGVQYQWATPDGSKVFFTANAGLTEESSPSGTDLYEYDLEAEELTDLSVSDEAGGAQVGGFVAAAEDGSRVYFIARAQLVPGRGETRAQNQSAGTYSLYGNSGGEIDFVGTVSGDGSSLHWLVEPYGNDWSSRASADGRYLVFETSTNVTGYESGGALEAYLYDAADGSEGTVCVSCRQDGQPSVGPGGSGRYEVLKSKSGSNYFARPMQFLAVRNGEPRVFFSSPDELAPGAVVGQNNVYEWSHGQVFRLTSAAEGTQSDAFAGYFAAFIGTPNDGSDAYIVSPENLSWEDGDERLSIYDARIGGGFPEPPPPPSSCDPDTEGSCQGSGSAAATLPGAASSTFSGPGNPAPQAEKKKKKAKKHKKKHAKKKHKRARHANANRRAGK